MRIVFETKTKTTKALKFVTESIFEKFLHARKQFGLKTNCVCSQLGNDVLKFQMFTFHSGPHIPGSIWISTQLDFNQFLAGTQKKL